MKNASLKTAVRALVFLAGAYFSFQKVDDFWFVGPIFGAVVLIWEWSFKEKLDLAKAVGFFAASTLIYALVYRISKIDMPKIDKLFDSVYCAVIVGSFLMPVAYKLFFGGSLKKTLIAIPAIYAIFYLSSLVFPDVQKPAGNIINIVTFWQGAYLFLLCSPFLNRFEN